MSAPVTQIVTGITSPLGTLAAYLGNQQAPIVLPDATLVFDAYRKGYIKDKLAEQVLLSHGIVFSASEVEGGQLPSGDAAVLNKVWHRIWETGQQTPDDDMITQLYLRDEINDIDREKLFRKNGWINPNYLGMIAELSNIIPSPNQLIDYAVKQCFNPVLVSQWGLDTEYPQELDKWMKANGILWDTHLPQFGFPVPSEVTFARMNWWS